MTTYGAIDAQIEYLIKASVAQKKLPPVLYRYRAFDKYMASSIANAVQMFSVPFGFNDPFDCQINDSGEYTYKEFRNYLMRGDRVDRATANAMANMNHAQGGAMARRALSKAKTKQMQSTGVLCLSSRPDSILMWSHYANCHRGYVLGFTVLKDPAFFVAPCKVKYQAKYPNFSYIRSPLEIVPRGMSTKSQEWHYEKEVRIIKKGPGLKQFKKACLTEIILGCRITKRNMNKMKRLLLNDPEYSHVVLKQATVSATAFKVNIAVISNKLTSK
jgi:Protein of unknown function (DUF2971)